MTYFSGHLLTGDHASRPAAGDVPEGTLYSCSDHGLVYQSDGAAWSTWATLGETGTAAHIADAVDAHDASAISFAPAGTIAATDVQAAIEEVAAEAGSIVFAGARVRAVANVALTSGSIVYITWDTEDYDTDAFHSTASDTSRMTIPAGKAGKYRITAHGFTTASPGDGYTVIRLNGTTIIANGWYTDDGNAGHVGATTEYDLAEGDYVEFGVQVGAASKNLIDAGVCDPAFSISRIG